MKKMMSRFCVRIVCLAFLLAALLLPLNVQFAQCNEGTPIQKDLYLDQPISGVEDLPSEVTICLYDSESANAPIATQAFPRGQYALDFEFNKSDGVVSGPIGRLNVNFTNKLDMGDNPENPNKVKEIWAEVRINGQAVGDRTKVKDETLVRLLLASNASIATYLTLAYEGDGSPITTIYKDLPLASGTSANDYITSIFSSYYSPSDASVQSLSDPYWDPSGNDIYYNNGYVGIGTATPASNLHIQRGASLTDVVDSNSAVQLESSSNATNFWFNVPSAASGGINATMGFATDGTIQHGMTYNAANDYLILTNDGANGSASTGIIIDSSGNIGVGTTTPSYLLAVKGAIGCQELTVTNTGWPDFVFEENYRLPSLNEVEEYISTNKHLPGIPTEAEVKEKGVSVGKISSKLLQKIEELTLYVIDLKKENDSLKSQIADIENQLLARSQ